MKNIVLVATTIALANAGIGCASIRSEVAGVQKHELGRDTRIEKTQYALVTPRVDGDHLSFRVQPACRVLQVMHQDEVTTYRKLNESKGLDITMGVLGAVAVGAGAWMAIDASNVATTSTSARVYNPVGPDVALGTGAGLAAVGAGLLAIPVTDMIRSSGTRDEHRLFDEDGEELASGVECKNGTVVAGALRAPASKGQVTLGLGFNSAHVQADDVAILSSGESDLVLSALLPEAALRSASRPEIVSIRVDSVVLSETQLAPAYKAADDARWARLENARKACASPSALNDCDQVDAESKQYPASIHAADARKLVAAAGPAFVRIRDQAAWSNAKSPECLAAESEDACEPLKEYLASWPRGQHVVEARAALAKGLSAIKAMLAKQAAAERAAERREAAAARQEAQREAASSAGCKQQCETSRRNSITMCAGLGMGSTYSCAQSDAIAREYSECVYGCR
jgi:hypothetical protein